MGSVLEMYLCKLGWPVAVLLSVVALAVAAYYVNSNNNTTHLKEQIVQTCASAPNAVTCAKNIITTVNSVNQ